MTKATIIREIAFEKECTLRQAKEIYNGYKKKNKLSELEQKLKNHKEI